MRTLSTLLLAAMLSPGADAGPRDSHDRTISTVESMVWDQGAQQRVNQQGLSLVNVTWEDTGRSKGSVWGPNISDMTIGVRDGSGALHPMPVLRYDNFNDVTADLRSDQFMLLTGNEHGGSLEAVSLDNVLKNTRAFLHDRGSWGSRTSGLWASRDEHVLVSAQACLLPVPKGGEATFTPVLYNYQSYPGDPAVLTIVASRQGTSIQVIENNNGYMSQPLFFNLDGERAPFVAERKSDWVAGGGDRDPVGTPLEASVQEGMHNVVLVIQVPLKQKNPSRYGDMFGMAEGMMLDDMSADEPAMARSAGMEEAVVSYGETEGPFAEINNLDIERDTRFPVRVTVQFYQATDTGELTDADVRRLKSQIDRVYQDASFVGSLVTDGYTGRPTEWVEPPATTQATWATPGWGWLRAH